MTRARGMSRRPAAGTTTIEFALTALPMLMFVIGLLQGGVQLWRWQALEGAAIDAARCAGINATSCQNASTAPANTATYAATAANLRGLSGVTSSNVTVKTGTAAQTACGSTSVSVVSVAVSYTFATIVLVPLPATLTASACFPLAASG